VTLRIGDNEAGENFAGTLDDVRIYNKALSQQEIDTLYNAGLPSHPTDMTVHWKLDETGNTSTAADSAGSNNGTLTNFPADPTANWVSGLVDGTLTFDGVDDHVTHSYSVPRAAGTISQWLKPDQVRVMMTYYESDGTDSNHNGLGQGFTQLEIDTGIDNSLSWHGTYQDGDGRPAL